MPKVTLGHSSTDRLIYDVATRYGLENVHIESLDMYGVKTVMPLRISVRWVMIQKKLKVVGAV